MKKRTFIFDGSKGAGEMLSIILNYYANVAFPLGGSECAAASREALQRISNAILQANNSSDKCVEIGRRQRPMLKSAVKWFYTQSEYASPDDPVYNRLLSQLQK